jgi:tetratricopeptide (TPR) repeat protein
MLKGKLLIFCILFLSFLLQSQTQDPYDLYSRAINEQDQTKRLELLKEYLSKYGGLGTLYEKYVLANLALIYSKKEEFSKVIDYGERAFSFTGLNDLTRVQLYIALSYSYAKLGQNLSKAKNYAEIAIELSQANLNSKNLSVDIEKWNELLGAGYFAKASVLKKLQRYESALDYFIRAYEILKNNRIIDEIKEEGKVCYKLKLYESAERAFSLTVSVLNDFDSLNFYAKTLYHNGKISQALSYFKRAYNKNPNSDTAYNIGIILAKDENTIDEAIKYLAEAIVLKEKSELEEVDSLLKHLFFNVKKGTQEEFEKLLSETRRRIKKNF